MAHNNTHPPLGTRPVDLLDDDPYVVTDFDHRLPRTTGSAKDDDGTQPPPSGTRLVRRRDSRLPSATTRQRPDAGAQRRSGSPPRRNLLQDEDQKHSSRRPSPPEVRPSYSPSNTRQVSDMLKSRSPRTQEGVASLIHSRRFVASETSSTQTHSSRHVSAGSYSSHGTDQSLTGAGFPPAVVASRTVSTPTVSSHPKPTRVTSPASPSAGALLESVSRMHRKASAATQTHSSPPVSTGSSSSHVLDPSRTGAVPLESAVIMSRTASTRAAPSRRQDTARATGSSAAAPQLLAPPVARKVSRANHDQRGLPRLQVPNAQAPHVSATGVSHPHPPPGVGPLTAHGPGVYRGAPLPTLVHVDRFAKDSKGYYRCHYDCQEKFTTQEDYEAHARSHDPKPFKCPKCHHGKDKGCATIAGYKLHVAKNCPKRIG